MSKAPSTPRKSGSTFSRIFGSERDKQAETNKYLDTKGRDDDYNNSKKSWNFKYVDGNNQQVSVLYSFFTETCVRGFDLEETILKRFHPRVDSLKHFHPRERFANIFIHGTICKRFYSCIDSKTFSSVCHLFVSEVTLIAFDAMKGDTTNRVSPKF